MVGGPGNEWRWCRWRTDGRRMSIRVLNALFQQAAASEGGVALIVHDDRSSSGDQRRPAARARGSGRWSRISIRRPRRVVIPRFAITLSRGRHENRCDAQGTTLRSRGDDDGGRWRRCIRSIPARSARREKSSNRPVAGPATGLADHHLRAAGEYRARHNGDCRQNSDYRCVRRCWWKQSSSRSTPDKTSDIGEGHSWGAWSQGANLEPRFRSSALSSRSAGPRYSMLREYPSTVCSAGSGVHEYHLVDQHDTLGISKFTRSGINYGAMVAPSAARQHQHILAALSSVTTWIIRRRNLDVARKYPLSPGNTDDHPTAPPPVPVNRSATVAEEEVGTISR